MFTFLVSVLVELNKLFNLPLEMCFVQLSFEPLAAEIGKCNQQVHQHTHFYLLRWLFDDLEDRLNYQSYYFRFLSESILNPTRVDYISEHSSSKVKTKDMNFGVETLLD